MLKEQIEKSFYITYPKRSNCLVNITEECKQGVFKLCDEVACKRCILCVSDVSQRENIRVSSQNAVYIIWMNQVISYVKESVGKCCDAVISDPNKILFLEMTCSNEKHVNSQYGKRRAAIGQLLNTICIFNANCDLNDYIKNRERRYAVFSWKDTSQFREEADLAEKGFIAFTDFSDEVYSRDNFRTLDNGFIFKEIRYPDVLRIDEL